MLQQKRVMMQQYSNDLIFRLKDLHVNFDKYKFYPRDERYKSAIYDSDKTLIFSTLESNDVDLDSVTYTSNSQIHFIEEPESYYLGAKYVVLEIPDELFWYENLKKRFSSLYLLHFSLCYFLDISF